MSLLKVQQSNSLVSRLRKASRRGKPTYVVEDE